MQKENRRVALLTYWLSANRGNEPSTDRGDSTTDELPEGIKAVRIRSVTKQRPIRIDSSGELNRVHIVTDLQWLISSYRIIFGKLLAIDIPENYKQNILWGLRRQGIGRAVRLMLARWAKKLTVGWKNGPPVILAERVYLRELSLAPSRKGSLVENVMISTWDLKVAKPQSIENLVIVGTLGRHYQTDLAIWFANQISKHYPCRLTVCGMSPDPGFARELGETIDAITKGEWGSPTLPVEIVGGDLTTLKPRQLIEETMGRPGSLLMMPYRISPATRDRIPTKLYNALEMGVPMLMGVNPAWVRHTRPYRAALTTDWTSDDAPRIARLLATTRFYDTGRHAPTEVAHRRARQLAQTRAMLELAT